MKGSTTRKNMLTPGARALGIDASALQEMIAKKAYELFAQRGYQHGHHEEDWREAERLVCSHLEPVSELGAKSPSKRPDRPAAARRQASRH
jgi:hypothetical protein